MKIQYLSASRLNTYVDCPFKYFLTYELQLPELKQNTIHTRKGSAVHEVLESYAKGERDYLAGLRKYYSETQLWALDNRPDHRGFPHPQPKACDTCKWAVNSNGATICTIADKFITAFDGCPKGNFEDDLGLVEKTLGREDSPLKRNIVGAEVPFDEVYEGFRVHGFIDLIVEHSNETIEVIDYKTGNWTKNANDAFRDLQMRIYSVIAKKLYPKYSFVMMTLDYLRKRPVTVIFSEEDDKKTLGFLKDAYQKISADKNPARIKSRKCDWCVGYEQCGKIRESFIANGQFKMPEPKRLPTI